jgi:hypothetical protein
MPLDVQPLSRSRHVLMIAVMLALLAGSLGFAQWLVVRRQAAMPVRRQAAVALQVSFPSPPGVSGLPVNASTEEVMHGRFYIAQANWPGGPRQFAAFRFPARSGVNPWTYLTTLFSQLAGTHQDQPLHSGLSILAGHRAMQVWADSQTDDTPAFSIMRMATVSGYVVAFCFSGDGDLTDEDWRFFDDYCTRQVRIQEAQPPVNQG